MKVIRRPKSYDSHAEALPAASRIVRRWPSLTTRIVRDGGLLYVEFCRRSEATS